jgi:hypothetical protein
MAARVGHDEVPAPKNTIEMGAFNSMYHPSMFLTHMLSLLVLAFGNE